jgi:hypothetical protein
MAPRGIPVALVIAAAAADGAGAHGVALYALLAAVPAAAVAGLEAYGDALEDPRRRPLAFLWAVVLALTVTGAAARTPALAEGTVPAIGRSAVIACLAIFCVQALAALVSELRSH